MDYTHYIPLHHPIQSHIRWPLESLDHPISDSIIPLNHIQNPLWISPSWPFSFPKRSVKKLEPPVFPCWGCHASFCWFNSCCAACATEAQSLPSCSCDRWEKHGNSMEILWDFHRIFEGMFEGILGGCLGIEWDFNWIFMGFNRIQRVFLVGFHGDISALWQWVMEDMEGWLAWCISWVVTGTWCWDDLWSISTKKMERRHGICYHLCTNTYETSHELEIQASKHPRLRHAKRSYCWFVSNCIQIIPSHSPNPNPI